MTRDPRDHLRGDELVDALLDGGLSHADARDAYDRLRRDPAACEDLARIRYTVARLAAPVETPDLTEAILHRVHDRRRFLPRRERRIVTVGRVAVAAGVVAAVGLASFIQRAVPQVNVAEAPAPVGRVVETTGLRADEQPRLMAETVETIRSTLASPVARLSLSPAYRPEEQVRFDVAMPATAAPRPETYAAGGFSMRALRAQVDRAAGLAATSPEAENPFLLRFEPLLVILAEPQPRIDDERPHADDR